MISFVFVFSRKLLAKMYGNYKKNFRENLGEKFRES